MFKTLYYKLVTDRNGSERLVLFSTKVGCPIPRFTNQDICVAYQIEERCTITAAYTVVTEVSCKICGDFVDITESGVGYIAEYYWDNGLNPNFVNYIYTEYSSRCDKCLLQLHEETCEEPAFFSTLFRDIALSSSAFPLICRKCLKVVVSHGEACTCCSGALRTQNQSVRRY